MLLSEAVNATCHSSDFRFTNLSQLRQHIEVNGNKIVISVKIYFAN